MIFYLLIRDYYEAVKDYTWDSYTKRIIEILKS